MSRVRDEYDRVAVGARVVVLWHGKEHEGVVFHRIRGSGRLCGRLLNVAATPEIAPDHYVCTILTDGPDPPSAPAPG